MRTDKPVLQRTYVTATDAITKKSESITVYGATPQAILRAIEKLVSKNTGSSTSAA